MSQLQDNPHFLEFARTHSWKNRRKQGYPWKGALPTTFIAEIYKDWIPEGMTQGDLLKADKTLWAALQNELRTRAAPDWLPKESDARLNSITDPDKRQIQLYLREKWVEAKSKQHKSDIYQTPGNTRIIASKTNNISDNSALNFELSDKAEAEIRRLLIGEFQKYGFPPDAAENAVNNLAQAFEEACIVFAWHRLQDAQITQERTVDEPTEVPSKAPALWAQRTTGREVSPVDWIKKHYGRWVKGKWDRDGLELADINRADRPLYSAYIQRIRRNPEEDLGLPVEPRAKYADPVKTLEMKRAANRDYMRRKSAKVKAEFDAFGLNGAQAGEKHATDTAPPLPSKAPALWKQRTTGPEVPPPQFIEKHYSKWLGRGLTRSDLRKLDRPLYQAFASWIRRNPDKIPDRLKSLVTVSPTVRVQAELDELGITDPKDAYKIVKDDISKADRLYQAALNRRKKSQSPKPAGHPH